VFTNRRQDKVKILYWERNGFCLWQKRLEEDRFHWPQATAQGVMSLSGQQLNWLLDGFDLQNWHPHAPLDYQGVV
jgi:transposase